MCYAAPSCGRAERTRVYGLGRGGHGCGATNTPNFDAPGTNMSQAATFGVISSAGGSRAVQGSARVVF